MNERKMTMAAGLATMLLVVGGAMADSFGMGENQFSLDFVPISGSTNPTSGIPAGDDFTFTGVSNDYRMGALEVTNDQWDKFKASLGVPVTGSPSYAYDQAPPWVGTNVPTTSSWCEAAQFVNWLNTSTDHHAAYNFTGAQGTSNYTLDTWSDAEADNGTNFYRHKDAFYYLPTEDEWVKAAYWNGTSLQTYATKAGESLTQGNGTSGMGWNYYTTQYATNPEGPWNVGSGSQELNGTYDMMGNLWEWVESPYYSGGYGADSDRAIRGGTFFCRFDDFLLSTFRNYDSPYLEYDWGLGFRVASEVLTYHPGDATRDGRVNVDDLGILASNYDTYGGAVWETADFTGDGNVNVDDLGILASNYDWALSGGQNVPEPTSLALLVVGALLAGRRKGP